VFPVYQILDGLQDHQILTDLICSLYGEAGSWETLLLEVYETLRVSGKGNQIFSKHIFAINTSEIFL